MAGISGVSHPNLQNSFMQSRLGLEGEDWYKIYGNNCIVLSRPLAAHASLLGEGLVDTYETITGKLQAEGFNLENNHIVANVVGNGATEKHITTWYKPSGPDARVYIYDPKTGDAEKYLSRLSNSLVRKAWDGFIGAFRALIPNYTKEIDQDKIYQSLGVQSYFDPITCGYYSLEVSRAITELVGDNQIITVDAILDRLALRNPVQEALATIQAYDKSQDTRYSGFIKKAWHDTFIAPAVKHPKVAEEYGIMNYFAGYPLEAGPKRVLYYASLSFLITPLINTLKIPTEFAVKALAETASYLKNRLLFWTPTSNLTQYLRSAVLLAANGLHFALEGAWVSLRTITSPVNSFEAGYKVHWTLGLLSACLSTAFWAGVAVFALPAVPGVALMGGLAVALGFKGILNWGVHSYFAKPEPESSKVMTFDDDVFNMESEKEMDKVQETGPSVTPIKSRPSPSVPAAQSFKILPGSAKLAGELGQFKSSSPSDASLDNTPVDGEEITPHL
jgi:hypothetical protein